MSIGELSGGAVLRRLLIKDSACYHSTFSTIHLLLIFVAGVCPLLCSGKGLYKNGECSCKPGWKGKECSIRYEECEVSPDNCVDQCGLFIPTNRN